VPYYSLFVYVIAIFAHTFQIHIVVWYAKIIFECKQKTNEHKGLNITTLHFDQTLELYRLQNSIQPNRIGITDRRCNNTLTF